MRIWLFIGLLLALEVRADEPVPLERLAPRPPAPAPSGEPADGGLNPMLKQKRLPRAKKGRKSDVKVHGAATGGYGAGDVRTKVGEF